MASWILTHNTKAKKKEEQEENKDDHVSSRGCHPLKED